MDKKDTIGVQEMAAQLGVTTQTIYNYLDKGIIPNTRVRRGIGYRRIVLRADWDAAVARLLGDGADDDTISADIRPTDHAVSALQPA